ncbi:hypothetical protein F5880DRAFT_1511375 [Lentinula raphanica]|nr:hypothetical protein F5880DRAFT_1511375 [Lentinula raphanica]
MTSNVFSAIVLFAQSIPLAAGSYGGVTGIDSIARSVCALVDQTIGPLLLYGLLNLCYPDLQIPFFNLEFHTQRINVYGFNVCYLRPRSSVYYLGIRMARTGFIHMKGWEPARRGAGDLAYRANWLDIGNAVSRSGRFRVRWSCGGRKTSQQLEEGLSRVPDGLVYFAPNSNHWIYPYLLGRQPREAGHAVVLSRECLIDTAALAVARFAIFLASSIVVILFHVFVILILFEDNVTKAFLIVGDIGRWLLVVGQVSSVLTYSLDYKGVCSWAAPKTYGTPWTRREQIQCRNRVLHCMGKMYHAHAVFRFAAWLWPKITTAKIGKRWPDILGKEGIFSSFQCYTNTDPHQDFADSKSTLLRLSVSEKEPGETSIDHRRAYFIDFKVPTAMIQSGFETRLQPNPTQQRYNFLVMGPLCIFNVLTPFVLIWRDGQSANPFLTLFMSSFFQVAVLILNYKDLDDQSINCRFEAIPQSVQDYPPSPLWSNSRMAKDRLSTQRDTRVDAPDRTGTKHESMSTAMLRADSSAAETFVHVQEDDHDEAEGIRDRKGKSKAVN